MRHYAMLADNEERRVYSKCREWPGNQVHTLIAEPYCHGESQFVCGIAVRYNENKLLHGDSNKANVRFAR